MPASVRTGSYRKGVPWARPSGSGLLWAVSVTSLEAVTLQVQLRAPVCALLCAISLIWLVVGIFVYKDAANRGMSGIA